MMDQQGLLPASLQPWTRAESGSKSFATALGRIYAERGHFRHIKESQLRAEIASNAVSDAPSPSDSEMEDADVKDPAPATVSRADQLAQARREAIEHVASAQNEALLALDFVSLLLSKDVKQAESTISPILKQGVPPGTLGLDMWAGMTPDAKVQETDRLLARGKRMESLNNSANALMAASDRLKTTVDRERKYWSEMLKIRESGWSVCRMPRETGTLGVRYGFSESKGEFGRRGLAALRMGRSGDVVLDRGLGTQAKALRVRIVQNGIVKGESSIKLARESAVDNSADVVTRIRTARDSLFEEEVFHEAMREARTLGGYGVKMRGTTISMPVSYADSSASGRSEQDTQVEVDLVSEGDQHSTTPNVMADGIATALRLLLSHTHRQRLEKRSGIPAPMSSTTVDKPVSEIIRPLLSAIHHQFATKRVASLLSATSTLLSRAQISTSQTATHALDADLSSAKSTSELFAALCRPYTSELKFSVDVPTPSGTSTTTNLAVKVTTWLSPPTHRGTTFSLSCPDLPSLHLNTTSIAMVEEHVSAVLQAVLTKAAAAWLSGWNVDAAAGRLDKPVFKSSSGTSSLEVRVASDTLALSAGGEEVTWTLETIVEQSFADAMTAMAGRLN